MISVAILTFNEAADLPDCLSSIAWCDDIHVVDSGSTDSTVRLAQDHGAQTYANEFASFGQQWNWALDHCHFKHPWVLFLDADERSTEVFAAAVREAVASSADDVAGHYCCWKLMLENQWLKHSDSFPKWQFRLLKRGRARFTDYGHGQKEWDLQGRLEYIAEPYLHFAFSKGWTAWLDRHNRYSSQEARARLDLPVRWQDVFSRHASIRNKTLKPLLSRTPGWPLLAFIQRYVLSLGFLDGRAGLIYAINMAYYEFLIRLKMDELRKHPSRIEPAGQRESE